MSVWHLGASFSPLSDIKCTKTFINCVKKTENNKSVHQWETHHDSNCHLQPKLLWQTHITANAVLCKGHNLLLKSQFTDCIFNQADVWHVCVQRSLMFSPDSTTKGLFSKCFSQEPLQRFVCVCRLHTWIWSHQKNPVCWCSHHCFTSLCRDVGIQSNNRLLKLTCLQEKHVGQTI